MDFERLKSEVKHFGYDSTRENPSDAVNAYFSRTDIGAEDRIWQAEQLLDFLAKAVAQPQTYQDKINSGSPGVICMNIHFAYPLLLTVLGWWVDTLFYTETAKELTQEEKGVLYSRLNVGLRRWDWNRLDEGRYDGLLRQLLPPKPPKAPEEKKPSILKRLVLSFCGNGGNRTP